MYNYFLPRNDNNSCCYLLSLAQIYLQLYGSQRETHGLRFKIEIGDEVQQALTSTGPVLSLDDKRKYINENLEGLVIPFTVMRKHINALGNFHKFVCYIPINIFFHFI